MIEPFASFIDFNTGKLEQYDNIVTRRLSDMKGIFSDESAYQNILSNEDDIVYQVYEKNVPTEQGQLAHAVTIIKPGKIGNEYYMTKGHFHVIEDTAELYLCVKGEGGIIMETKEGETKYIEMTTGTLVYVAPFWSHRTINTSDNDFAFLAIYPANAGHDYGTIEEEGFKKLVVEQDGESVIVDNPKRAN
jgi:glucose-6-phosphate isomerase